MTDVCKTDEVNADYRRKIPVFAEDIDDEDSNDYLLYKITRLPKKVQINIELTNSSSMSMYLLCDC